MDDLLASLSARVLVGVGRLQANLPRILADPRGHRKEAMLLALIAALAIVLFVVTGFVVADAVRAMRYRRRYGVRVRRRRPLRAIPLVAAGAIVALAALAAASAVPPAGQACGACHAMGEAVESWRASAHAKVACWSCHAPRGLLWLAEGIVGAAAASSGESSASPVKARSEGCVACHAGIRGKTVGTSIRMRHSDVIDAGMPCTKCHPSAGHDGLERRRGTTAPRPLMSVCLTCHDGERATADCGLCHTARPSDQATSPAEGGDTPAPVTCEGGCHELKVQKDCVACHGLEMPHPAAFFSEHAGRSFEDPGLCVRCHPTARASDGCGCHQPGDVHGAFREWFPRHGSFAQKQWPGGCNCHTKSFCSICHAKWPL